MEQAEVSTVLSWAISCTALVLEEPLENITADTHFVRLGATWYDKDVLCDLIEKIIEEACGYEIYISESGRGISTATVGDLAAHIEMILDNKAARERKSAYFSHIS